MSKYAYIPFFLVCIRKHKQIIEQIVNVQARQDPETWGFQELILKSHRPSAKIR